MSDKEIGLPETESANERRDFIKKSALAAGAIAGVSAITTTQAGTDISLSEDVRPKKTYKVSFTTRKLEPFQIQEALQKILDIAGCTACGFNGFDIRLGVDDIIELEHGVAVYS